MNYLKETEVAMRAKTGVIWIESREEVRIERSLVPIADRLKYELWTWTVTKGISKMGETGEVARPETKSLEGAFSALLEMDRRVILVCQDAGAWVQDPIAKRTARDLHLELQSLPKERAKQVIIIDREGAPEGLDYVTSIDCLLPDREEMGSIIDSFLSWAPDDAVKDVKKNGNREALISAMLGLTVEDASNALSRSLASSGIFDPKMIAKEKAQVIKGSGLEWYDPDERGLDAVGGMDQLKDWLAKRKKSFSESARAYGLPSPKGIVLAGIPGCGKSLTAKCVANAWNLPLIRMDVGALFSKYVGESEGKFQTALDRAEAIAPCILWIDEIEKAFASGGGESDGGTSTRVLNKFLTWMQERKDGVFIIATANDLTKFRQNPEFLRAGRWDELWFVDLPNIKERLEISNVMMQKFPVCNNEDVDPEKVAIKSLNNTGSEIEQAFIDAMYIAFDDGERPVKTEDILEAIDRRVPLSATMKEQIDELKKWAKGRARIASSQDVAEKTSGRDIE